LRQKTAISLRKRIVFTVVAVALAWLSAEAMVLSYWLGQPPPVTLERNSLYQAHPYRAYAPVPNTMNGVRTRSFNSFGLRGTAVSFEKPSNTIRIACLGGSTTYSDGATTDGHTYPARMERLLHEHYGDGSFRIEVLNAGVQACVSLESLIHFETQLLDLSPDIAIFHHGTNDGWFMIAFSDFQSDYIHVRRTLGGVPPKWWEYSPLLSYYCARRSVNNPYFPARNVNLNQLIITRPAILWDSRAGRYGEATPAMVAAFERNVHSFVSVARGNGVIPVLSTVVSQDDRDWAGLWFRAYGRINTAIRNVAVRESVDLIDFARLMPWNPTDFYDACHLKDTPGGLGRKAQIFAQALIEMGVVERACERRWEHRQGRRDR